MLAEVDRRLPEAEDVDAENVIGGSFWAVRSLAVRAAQVKGRLVRLTDPASRRARFARAKRPPRPTRFLRDLPVVR